LALTIMEATMALPARGGSRLDPCPPSFNCVTSLAKTGRQAIEPFNLLRDPWEESFQCLKDVVRGMKGTRIAMEEEGYFHAEFKTLLGFVDDVEFEAEPSQKAIHVRSASRLGYWDLGMNRRRVERIRTAYEAACH